MTGKRTVVVVEDDVDDAFFLTESLRRAGFDVPLVYARDGQQAVEMIEAERPVLVILDLNLPKLSGLEVLQRLRSSPELRDTPVVVLTASSESSDRDRAEALGVQLFFRKPTDTTIYATLAAQIRELVRAKA